MKSFDEYCAYVTSGDGAGERRHLLMALRTNVTHFFREPHHFTDLKEFVLPRLVMRAKRGERVRYWSAGTSSGEEAYSIALSLLEVEPSAVDLDIKILATDIDADMVTAGQDGVYKDAAMANVSVLQKRKYFEKNKIENEVHWRAKENARSLITFRELNLTRLPPLRGPFDVIFCRNVVIYFHQTTAQELWSNFAKLLAPGGVLYIGHSERVTGPATRQLVLSGATKYRRNANPCEL